MPEFQYIDKQDEFEVCCQTLQQCSVLAVDTEFVRERTFYPQPGLIQVFDGKEIYLFDPLALTNLKPFFDLLQDPDVVIIMHSSSEDIELFYSMQSGKITSLFDTQVAASWLGKGLSLSLQNLIADYEDVHIEKHLSRTDWLKRPLTDSQLAYAATDVLYLISIYNQQKKQLKNLDFYSHAIEDCALRCEEKLTEQTDIKAYLKVKRAITAKGPTLSRLKALATWREQKARVDDKPRQHILKDLQLISICHENPQTMQQLSQSADLPPFILRRYGEEIIKVLQNVSSEVKERTIAEPALSFRSVPHAGETFKACKSILLELHEKQNIPIEVLPSKRWLEQFLLHRAAPYYPMPDGWSGWRKQLLEKSFEEIILNKRFNQD